MHYSIAPKSSPYRNDHPVAGPGETQLMLSSNLTGSTASAANSVVNPTITIAGRKLQQA